MLPQPSVKLFKLHFQIKIIDEKCFKGPAFCAYVVFLMQIHQRRELLLEPSHPLCPKLFHFLQVWATPLPILQGIVGK